MMHLLATLLVRPGTTRAGSLESRANPASETVGMGESSEDCFFFPRGGGVCPFLALPLLNLMHCFFPFWGSFWGSHTRFESSPIPTVSDTTAESDGGAQSNTETIDGTESKTVRRGCFLNLHAVTASTVQLWKPSSLDALPASTGMATPQPLSSRRFRVWVSGPRGYRFSQNR
eukprot:4345104-Amphidinium_carterae.1